ncbi:MAG: acyltransferase [Acidimicrobiales bacterium]
MSGIARRLRRAARLRCWHIAVNVVARSHALSRRPRAALYRLAGIDVRSFNIYPGTYIAGPDLVIREGAFVNVGCVIDNAALVDIGERCFLGPGVLLCTTSHEPGPHSQRAGPAVCRPIVLGAGSWIGAGATILGGVTVGAGAVVAAGAVVVRDCAPDTVYAGVPAKELRPADQAPGDGGAGGA